MARSRPKQALIWAAVIVLVLAFPAAEAWLLDTLGRQIGFGPTVAILLISTVLGLWLALREGSKAGRALSMAFREGRMPSREMVNATLILVGGIALLVPGLLSDLIGLMLLIPVTRTGVRRAIGMLLARRISLLKAESGVITGQTAPAGAGQATATRDTDGDGTVIAGRLLP